MVQERASGNPWFAKLNFSSAQATMRRLDKAYAAFFRRLQAGEKPGYPRFKVAGRYDSIEFPPTGMASDCRKSLHSTTL